MPLHLALVAMPWSSKERPSAALAALGAFARRERPAWEVSTHSAFLGAYKRIGARAYDALADDAYEMGELLYAALVYPERRGAVLEQWALWARAHGLGHASDGEDLLGELEEHLRGLATQLAGADVVGLTTSFGQLFANIALARALEQTAPACQIVLGGSTVSGRVGPSLLEEYGCIDAVVQGEGERALVAVLDARESSRSLAGCSPAVVARESADGPAAFDEVIDLDELPYPDYDEYAAAAESCGVGWALPVEGSRGCYWDRTRRAGNPKATCHFCNLNVQWGGYREKSPARVAEEVRVNATRHQNVRAYFVDNILRHDGAAALARSLRETGLELDIFIEMRAHVRSEDFVALWEAGVSQVQFGIEALSSRYLARLGKGTTLLQNLRAMRLCAEFGVPHGANLITHFPGTTAAEVDECVRSIETHARAYEPLHLSKFHLGMGSTVDVLRREFRVSNVRNADIYRVCLPDEVWRRLELFDLDFDQEGPPLDWAPLYAATAEWQRLHDGARGGPPLLSYRDGGSFISIEDRRFGELRAGTFDRVVRAVLLGCMDDIRSSSDVACQVEALGGTDDDARAILDHLVSNGIVAQDGDRFLSLPVAATPAAAVRRIRRATTPKAGARRRVPLPLLSAS